MSAEFEMSEKAEITEPATLQVSEEAEKLNVDDGCPEEEVDVSDRDPNDMNPHVKVQFSEIFAEPDKEIFSFDKVWILSIKIFTCTKLWCYRITSLICAIPLAVCWGVYFACLSFCSIWCCMPCMKSCQIELYCVRRYWEIVLGTFIGPCFEAMGRCCGGVKVRMVKEP